MTKPQSQTQVEVPETPAKITQLHVLGRPATDKHMRPVMGVMAWSKLSPLEAAYGKNQLAGGNPKYPANLRLEAGKRYADIWATAQASGRDSTDIDRVCKSGGGLPIGQAQADAIRSLIAIESHMGERDRKIVRMVCGLEYFPSEAVREVCGDYKHTIAARFREALDSLVEALETARRAPGKFSVARETP